MATMVTLTRLSVMHVCLVFLFRTSLYKYYIFNAS